MMVPTTYRRSLSLPLGLVFVGLLLCTATSALAEEPLQAEDLHGTWLLDLDGVDWRTIPGWESLDDATYEMAINGVKDAVGDMRLKLSKSTWVVESGTLSMSATYSSTAKDANTRCLLMKSIESYEQNGQKVAVDGLDLTQLPQTCIERRKGVLWMTQEGQPIDFPLKKVVE